VFYVARTFAPRPGRNRVADMIKGLFGSPSLTPTKADIERKPAGLARAGNGVGSPGIGLAAALTRDWVEFWYQPKISLQHKIAVGAEIFARVRHPSLGLLPPSSFLKGADDRQLANLTRLALISAMKAGEVFSLLGINLRLAINVSLNSLLHVPIGQIVREHRPTAKEWPGLIFDVTESQLVADRPLLHEILTEIHECGIKLAIDDYSGGQLPLARLKELPFVELKLDRAFVRDCANDKDDAAICQSIIHLAHSFGGVAVAIGVEKAADVTALQSMGCDVGQGFLFGQPMPLKQFVDMLRDRSARQVRQASTPSTYAKQQSF
jgi:EAL domain-containing protein (putative c-di-GMP-specific phosphodiesterase class I)